ncbi:MAG TPA: lycopene cyclase family protein [Flavisolibacter sp.]|nr:lycopene cyclase family protein [Flavisolibacter sp.]
MSHQLEYDYIIAGAGCAGLSLAMHLIRSGDFGNKKILLIDRAPKTVNDRTWCFWEMGTGLFERIVYAEWERLLFFARDFSGELVIDPYRYKMIRGIDFYDHCLERIRAEPNFTIRFEPVDHVFSSDVTTGISVGGRTIHCEYVFNSIIFERPLLSEKEYWMLQHFRGWLVETDAPLFSPQLATLMDFRTGQQWGTAFFYVLPFSEKRALIEYTLFSPQVLDAEQYSQGLDKYIREVLQIDRYRTVDEESGVIPMTNCQFLPNQNNIINIGTAGGQTKGSSGYTFQFIQKHSAQLTAQLKATGKPFIRAGRRRHSFYDSILLNILHHKVLTGESIFTRLFEKNAPARVLKFLDNETSLAEELKIISSLPTMPFLKAAIEQML